MPAISALADVSIDTFVKGVAASADLNTAFTSLQTAVNDLNDVASDLEDHHAGSSNPTDNTVRGKLWADTSNTGRVVLKLDPDGSGCDDEVATRLEAYLIDFATAGTATFRQGGAINVDTTQVALAGSTGVLESYTLPAGTLARNGQYIHTIIAGTKTNANADASIQIRFNTGVQHTFTLDDNATKWGIEWWIIRTAAATQKFFAYMVMNRDDTAQTDIAQYGTDAETLANALAIDANLSSVNASDTVTKEIMIVEFGNY